jgi:hypothetical protein
MTTLIVCLFLSALPPDDTKDSAPPAREESAEASETAAFARTEAAHWKLSIDSSPPQQLELRSDPVLRWSNPAVGRVYGSVFLWTSEGRPVAAASIYRWYAPYTQRTAEFVLLSDRPVVAEREGRKVWTPAAGQVSFQPLDGAETPDASSRKRLAQMRRLAGEFVPELTDKRVVGDGTQQQLRLLDKPIYQYGAGPDGLIEGALFAFVVGTDPEVLLLVEARESRGKSAWHYALARMNRDAMRVRRNEREVWSVPFLEKPWGNSRGAYFLSEIDPALRPSTNP